MIEDTPAHGHGQASSPPWIASNLRDAIYNLTDENIRYLYNKLGYRYWPIREDRERAIKGRLAVERRALSTKFAKVLETGPRLTEEGAAIGSERASPSAAVTSTISKSDLGKSGAAGFITAIGNDIEQIVFFGG